MSQPPFLEKYFEFLLKDYNKRLRTRSQTERSDQVIVFCVTDLMTMGMFVVFVNINMLNGPMLFTQSEQDFHLEIFESVMVRQCNAPHV